MKRVHGLKRLAFFVLLAIAAPIHSAFAQTQKTARLYWDELPTLILKHEIVLDLSDGTHLQGQVRDVNPRSLVLLVKQTSGPALHPKGLNTIPRSDVSQLEYRAERAPGNNGEDAARSGRVLGGVLGAAAGIGIGVPVAISLGDRGHDNLGVAALGGIVVGGLVIGEVVGRFLLGPRSGKETILVDIVPEPPATATSGTTTTTDPK